MRGGNIRQSTVGHSEPLYTEIPASVSQGRPVVAAVWRRRACGGRYVVLPDGQTDLLFRRSQGEWRGLIVGPLPLAMETEPTDDGLIGVRFALGTARSVIGSSLEDLAGRMVPLEDLGLVALLDPKLLESAYAHHAGLCGLGDALALRLPRRAPIDGRVVRAVALLAKEAAAVRDVACAVGITERHLLRLFREEVGLSPKRLASLLRLQRALSARGRTAAAWSIVAAAVGYCDEAHLVREVRALTGHAPTALASAMSDSFNLGHTLAPISQGA